MFNHAIFPGVIPKYYMDDENIVFIQDKIRRVLLFEYKQNVLVDRASIVRVMQRVMEERLEPVPRMNERVVMYITADVRRHQNEANNHLKWEAHYQESQKLYDPTTDRSTVNPKEIKLRNRLGKPQVGQTLRFYFV